MDKLLERQNQTARRMTKVLIVGAPNGGKSTLMKQTRLYFDQSKFNFEKVMNGFSAEILQNLQSALILALKRGVQLGKHSVISGNILLNSQETEIRIGAAFVLVQDPNLIEFVLNSNEVPANVKYQLTNAQRLIDGQVNAQDYLNSAQPLYFVRFVYKNNQYVFINNGKNLQKKWAQTFNDVSAILFVTDINLYFKKLEGKNLLLEQMQEFDKLINQTLTQTIPVILLLNKYDQFKVNVRLQPLNQYFPDFQREQTEQNVREYIQKRFEALNRTPVQKRQIYVFAVNVIDPEVVKRLVDTVTMLLQKEELKKIGFK